MGPVNYDPNYNIIKPKVIVQKFSISKRFSVKNFRGKNID